jgi:hypothetical protein
MRRFAVLVAAASLAAGCSAFGLDGGTGERARLRINRAKWENHQIPAYRYTYRRGCFFCPGIESIVLEVRNQAVIAAFPESSDEPLPYHLDLLPTVDDLFDIIESAIAQRVDLLEVEYHPVLGHPTRIAIDYGFNVADDEVSHSARDLVPITP